jgi:SAM-dependent methyltransferase
MSMKQNDYDYTDGELWGRFRSCLEEMPGRLLLEHEIAALENLMADFFGYYLLQAGYPGGQPGYLLASRISKHVVVDPLGLVPGLALKVQGEPGRLPVAGDSIDAVLLHHTLDFARDPHQVLREAERVLIPEGRLLVVGFNPWGPWGWWRALRQTRSCLTRRHSIGQRRVQDWLSLLGFDVELTRHLMFRPPLASPRLMQSLSFLESLGVRWWPALSAVYVLQAVKRVSTLTPIKPAWSTRARVVRGGAIEPTARG